MLKEFLEALDAKLRRGDECKVVSVPQRPRQVLLSQGGGREWVNADPPLRQPKFTSLASLLGYVQPEKDKAQLFLSQTRLVALLDASDRREAATLELTHTDVWRRVQRLREWTGFKPDSIVRELRNLGAPAHFVAAVRKLDFKRQSGLSAEAKHGRESLGRRVEAEVQGADEIPESFVLDTPVFVEAGCNKPVRVTVDVYLNVQAESVDLRVTADSQDAAVAEVLLDIRETILAADGLASIPVFLGSP